MPTPVPPYLTQTPNTTGTATYSIQKRLLTSLLLGLPLLWLIVTSISVWRLAHEINEINDTQITQLARYLIGISQAVDLTARDNEISPKIFNLKSDLLSGDLGEAEDDYMGFAVWDKRGKLLMADDNGRYFSFLPNHHGFLDNASKYQELNPFSHTWRLFYVHDAATQHVVAIGQNLKSRQEIIYKSLAIQLIPALIGIALLIVLTWVAVRRGFAPLNKISLALTRRDPQDKTPLSMAVPLEIQPLVQALNDLFDKVADALAREKRFTADASHELRSPLAAIKLQTDVLQQVLLHANLTDRQLDPLLNHVIKISGSADRASHLVEQLLILAKLAPQQGLDDAKFEKIDWMALSDEVLADVNRHAREKHSQLRRIVEIVEGVENETAPLLALTGNPVLIGLMLRNLLDNAIRYAPAHSLITLSLSSNAIKVIDTGNGVLEADLARLAERFYRPAGQNELGSGLGLSIVCRIAELHQLQVSMANVVDAGKIVGFEVTISALCQQV